MIVARSQYDDRGVMDSDLSCAGDPGLTKQSDAKDCDINVLFKRFEKSGQLSSMIVRDGRYGDFSAVPDYQAALEIVRHADEQFAALDASIRNRFDNDPAKFLSFATDVKNLDSLEEMGLLKPEFVEARCAARIAKAEADKVEAAAKQADSEKALISRIKAELVK